MPPTWQECYPSLVGDQRTNHTLITTKTALQMNNVKTRSNDARTHRHFWSDADADDA